MESQEDKKLSSSWLVCCGKGFPLPIPSSKSVSPSLGNENDEEKQDLSSPKTTQRKPGGWKAMPFVLGNETFERLANVGLLANFTVFLLTQFHMDQVSASNVINIWSGATSFLPLVGAYLCDAYIGRFLTIAFASFFVLLGMVAMTLIPWLPQLHPPPCHDPSSCRGPTVSQMGFLALALGLLSIGSAGIRPCSIPFGVDQFDARTEEGRKGINSFFNWYYTTFTMVLIISLTVVVYVQSNVSWVLGFAIPTILMVVAIILFFIGTKIYIHRKPEGSVFSGIAEGLVAAYRKRKLKLKLPDNGREEINDGVYYDPPLSQTIAKKLPLTNQFRFLNKAAMITEGDLKADGSRADKWNLSSIQQIEELKCILRIIPVWASGIICLLAMAQQGTFTLSQALKMDRRLGPKFQIPPGSLAVISMVTIGIWLPVYDRIVVPRLRRITKVEGGITLLQRLGVGMVFSILSMAVAGFVERKRRAEAIKHGGPDGSAPITVMWLAPQLILMGFAEAFNIIGQIELYNKEFPENMTSVANSIMSITFAGANYLSAIIVNIIHNTTGGRGHPDWLAKNINAGRLENFYFVIAGLGVLNLTYFLYVAPNYRYKSRVRVDEDDEEKPDFSIELNAVVKE
ncbi:unnamed protein product [Coffea canephora]|uniref:Major facilitator superfamily (MFS) profile domain-containing protein n=1 Tax=Coffea canephora TaxID=49390 RepID=A0A068TVH2_COFCA|nr:unnamed protein product [Coffea canephora]